MKQLKTISRVTVLGVCAFASMYVVYKFFNRNEDDFDLSLFQSKKKTLVFNIPKEHVSLIIGRGGNNIKSIEAKSNTRITFDNKITSNAPERVCTIVGTTADCENAKALIDMIIASQPVIMSGEMWVPQSSVGHIVGRGGDRITRISNHSGAKITLVRCAKDSLSKQQILLKGTSEQIKVAKSFIENILEDEAEIRSKMLLRQRDPRGKPRNNSNSDSKLSLSTEKLTNEGSGSDGQVEVYVSAVTDPSQFWLQLVGTKANELDQLVEDMTEYYSKPENQELHAVSEPSPGQIVAAMFNCDNKWYRAKIIELKTENDTEMAFLYFVDYGDTDTIPITEIFELRTDFLSLLNQAIECSLARIKPVGAGWSDDATDSFEAWTQAAQWKKLRARLNGCKDSGTSRSYGRVKREGSPIPCIDLYDISNQEDVDIAAQLVLQGHAVFEETVSSPRSSSLSMNSSRSSLNDYGHLLVGHNELMDVSQNSIHDKTNGNAKPVN